MSHNPLHDLGEKIFLDRYAIKDQERKDIHIDDKVVVCTNTDTGQREVGFVKEIFENTDVRVELKDGTVMTLRRDNIDKPLEVTAEAMVKRVARGIASVEKTPEKQKEWRKNFEWALDDWKFVPAGRILTTAGSDQQLTCYNCYVLPCPTDSRRGILDTLYYMTEIMSRGGGVGMNISSLRPKHAYVKGVNGRSSGSVSWGALYSFVTGLIEQGGSRRGALMLMLNDWHPDLMEFITVKQDMTKITNANLSIAVSDTFMDAVEKDKYWELKFPDTQDPDYDEVWDGNMDKWLKMGKKVHVYAKHRAKDIWDKLIQSAWKSAEPGLWFQERTNKMSNSWYYAPLVCTNPCGEQSLPAWGVCNLGHVNLARFANEEGTDVKWDDLRKTVRYALRFLDNVIDYTIYFFEENEKLQKSERRVGMGTIGLAELLIRLGIRYGSDKSLEFIDKLFKFIAAESYLMSAEIAKEKGSFPKFKATQFLQSGYMKQMPENVREHIRKNGIRNVTMNTQAPTGTVATMVGTSTGIEPFYSWSYTIKCRLGINTEHVAVAKEWKAKNPGQELPDYFVNAMELSPEEHVHVQGAIQKWVDSSISKTSNLPNSYTPKQVSEFYKLLYSLGCKGGTVYRDGSRDVQVLTTLDKKEEKKIKKQPVLQEAQTSPRLIPRKRPDQMQGTTYKIETGYGSLFVTVNRDENEQPFEVFATIGKTGGFFAAKSEAICRLISVALRSGIHPQIIIDQIKGIRGPIPYWRKEGMVLSIPDAIAQVLEQAIRPKNQMKLDLEKKAGAKNIEANVTHEAQATKKTDNQFASSSVSSTKETQQIPFAAKKEVVTAQVGTLDITSSSSGSTASLSSDAKSGFYAGSFESISIKTKTSIADAGFAPQCPHCQSILEMSEGCMSCRSCGYSKCS